MKRLLRKTEACFGGLKSPGLIRPLMIFFLLPLQRAVGPYRKVSWNTLKFSLSGVPIREEVELPDQF